MKISADSVTKVAEPGLYSYKELETGAKRICPYCNQEYTRYSGEIEYIFDNKKFCSFPCKNRYRKEHPEIDLKESLKTYSREELVNIVYDNYNGFYKSELQNMNRTTLINIIVEKEKKIYEKKKGIKKNETRNHK